VTATTAIHHRRETCRACDGRNLERFLELGPTPLANAFLPSPENFADEPSFPLDVYFCRDCSLVQLLDVIDPEVLFADYIYVTGTSTTIAEHNLRYAASVTNLLDLTKDDLVVEAGSNDGSLLKCFQAHGVRTLGVEPARNIARLAGEAGVETINTFFNSDTAEQVLMRAGPAKAVIGNNVLAHVDDTQDFLRGARRIIDRDGLVIVEVPWLGELLDRMEYDTIYHEHLCYFSVSALMELYDRVGLSIVGVDHFPVHGGSIRVRAGHRDVHGEHAGAVRVLARDEAERGITDLTRIRRLAADVKRNRADLLDLLRGLKDEGRTLAGYGAPAKGNTLVNFCGIDTDLIPWTVDRSPLKVGMYTPGKHIPVLPVETLEERQPDYCLILAWNFAEEISRQQAEYKKRGGRFIVPIPTPKVV
jgi:hypothetical protein